MGFFAVKTEPQANHRGLFPSDCALPPGGDPDFPREVPAAASAGEAGGGPGQGQASVQAHVLRDGEAAQRR